MYKFKVEYEQDGKTLTGYVEATDILAAVDKFKTQNPGIGIVLSLSVVSL